MFEQLEKPVERMMPVRATVINLLKTVIPFVTAGLDVALGFEASSIVDCLATVLGWLLVSWFVLAVSGGRDAIPIADTTGRCTKPACQSFGTCKGGNRIRVASASRQSSRR